MALGLGNTFGIFFVGAVGIGICALVAATERMSCCYRVGNV